MFLFQQPEPPPRLTLFESLSASFSNTEFYLKALVLLALAPFWWPVLKAMYQEIQAALRKEGGIHGRKPTEREVELLEEKHGVYESPLVSIPRRRGERTKPAPSTRGGAGRASGAVRSSRQRGF